MSLFETATKEKAKGKLAIIGPSGSGKTWTALLVAEELAGKDGRIAVIDSEHGSASKYSDRFAFQTLRLASFEPEKYIAAIQAAEAEGFDVVVVDSLSHAWAGKGGILEYVDREKIKSGNAFSNGWGKATPKHNALVESLLACGTHLIVTMRAKTEYVQEKDDKTGKTIIRKIGMQPIQRDGLEYEFDVVGDMDQENTLVVSKSRCPALSGAVVEKPGAPFAKTFLAWLNAGVAPKPKPPEPVKVETPAEPVPQDGGPVALIGEADIKRVHDTARAAGITTTGPLTPILRKTAEVDRVAAIPASKVDAVLEHLVSMRENGEALVDATGGNGAHA